MVFDRDCPAQVHDDRAFIGFVADTEPLVRKAADPAGMVAQAIGDLARAGWHPLDARYLQPQPGCKYGAYLLYLADDATFCVVLDIFLPGQFTDIHNHRTWGTFVCLAGEERETVFRGDPAAGTPPVDLVHRDNPVGVARTAGSGREALHRVSTRPDVTSVSLHVYGADILRLERDFWNRDAGCWEVRRSEYSEVRRSDYSNAACGLPRYLY